MAIGDYRGKGGAARPFGAGSTSGFSPLSQYFIPQDSPAYAAELERLKARQAPSTSSAASPTNMAVRSPSPMDMPKLIGQGMRVVTPKPVTTQVSGGGAGGSSVSSLFAPLFAALDQQRKLAESRYAENAGQIQNIYGQLIGARKADINDIQTAYQRLQQAAASRGEATISGMQTRESGRLAQNEAVLQSMGVGGIGTSAGDIASQSAAVAQDVERMNQSNWAGMLDAMGATSQDIARADVTSYGYAQAEDIAALQAARENYAQNIQQQEFDLKFQQQQAQLQAQQAAAANAARVRAAQIKAAQDAAEAASKQQGAQFEQSLDYLKNADPFTRAIGEEALYRGLSETDRASIEAAYNNFIATNDLGRYGLTAPQALAKLNDPGYTKQLSPQALATLKKAVLYTLNK